MSIKQFAPILLIIFAIFLATSISSLAQNTGDAGETLTVERCASCHPLSLICKRLGQYDAAKFQTVTERMVKHGTKLSPEEVTIVAQYLAKLPAGAKPVCE